MTLLVVSPDYASHALPLLTIAEAWQARGERVVVATGPAVAPLVARAGFELVELELGRGSNAGIARPEDQRAGEDANLRAFFEATRRGMVETLRYQAERRSGDLLWMPVATGRRTIEVAEMVRPDAILVDHVAFGATVGLRAAGIPYADVVLGHPTQLPVAAETFGVPSSWPTAFEPDAAALSSLRDVARGVASRFTGDYNDAMRTISPTAPTVPDAFAAHGPLVLFNYPEALHERITDWVAAPDPRLPWLRTPARGCRGGGGLAQTGMRIARSSSSRSGRSCPPAGMSWPGWPMPCVVSTSASPWPPARPICVPLAHFHATGSCARTSPRWRSWSGPRRS